MQRLLIVLALLTLNACSVYSQRGIPAPVESREGATVETPAPPFTGPMPDSRSTQTPSAGSSQGSGQTSTPQPARNDTRPALPPTPEPDNSGSPTSALMASANAAIAEGDLERAAALTERALRISPRDAYLWYKLADIRYRQQRYSDAAGFAQRARSFAGSDRQLAGAIDDLLERADERR